MPEERNACPDAAQLEEAADQKSRADEQHHGGRELEDHQGLEQGMAASRLPGAFTKLRDQVGARREKGRHGAEDESRHQGDG